MSDPVFRTASEPTIPTPEPEREPNKIGAEESLADKAPIEDGEQAVLVALGIDDTVRSMPDADQTNLSEVNAYIKAILEGRGVAPTQTAYTRTLEDLKYDMGLDTDAEPSMVLDRIGGVVKAWRNLSFISDPREKRRIFSKLSRAQSSSEMNKVVLQAMEEHEVWL